MKFYYSKDFDDEIILKSQSKEEAINAFLQRHPSFDRESIHPFIFEEEIHYTICLPEYEGWISNKKWKDGKSQKSVVDAIAHAIEALGRKRTLMQIEKLWKYDRWEIKKSYKKW